MQSLWMIVASFCFACMGMCVKLASETFSATEVVFYRAVISLAFMLAVVCFRGIPLKTPHWRFQLTRSICGFLGLVSFFNAISLLPLATAVTLNYTSPLFLAVLLACTGRILLRLSLLGALALGFVGVAWLLRPTFHADQLLGGLWGGGSGVLSAFAYYNVRELGELGETEERTVFYFSLFSTIGAALWMGLYEFHPVDLRNGLLLLGVGGFATVAQLAMTRAYKRGNTLVSASLAYTTVAFASLLGMAFWHESLTSSAWLAIGLIVSSGLISSWFSRANPADQD
ncbi:DMT family transporter [uncultured Propionivibrio sp.]|uniref:DMT family transporter n=1 Tax=uncultured Propionivibrio sp. TaxID=426737 RepID=UPI0029C0F623|nr:DMT family transporter [uncultured Propionivibrio sp.]